MASPRPRPHREGSPRGCGVSCSASQTGLRFPVLSSDVPFALVRLLGPVPICKGYGPCPLPDPRDADHLRSSHPDRAQPQAPQDASRPLQCWDLSLPRSAARARFPRRAQGTPPALLCTPGTPEGLPIIVLGVSFSVTVEASFKRLVPSAVDSYVKRGLRPAARVDRLGGQGSACSHHTADSRSSCSAQPRPPPDVVATSCEPAPHPCSVLWAPASPEPSVVTSAGSLASRGTRARPALCAQPCRGTWPQALASARGCWRSVSTSLPWGPMVTPGDPWR